jgi:hypothetical protein
VYVYYRKALNLVAQWVGAEGGHRKKSRSQLAYPSPEPQLPHSTYLPFGREVIVVFIVDVPCKEALEGFTVGSYGGYPLKVVACNRTSPTLWLVQY